MLAKLIAFSVILNVNSLATDRSILRNLARTDAETSVCTSLVQYYISRSAAMDPPKSWFDQHWVTVDHGGCSGLRLVFEEYFARQGAVPAQVQRVSESPNPRVLRRPRSEPRSDTELRPEQLAQYERILPFGARRLESVPEDAAICAGDGVGWLQVARLPDGRLSFDGRSPQTPSRPDTELPLRDDVLVFPEARPGRIHRDPAPCVLNYEAGCQLEPVRGRYVVAARTRFAVDIGGKEQWQFCLMPE